jgi:hypothetical protein
MARPILRTRHRPQHCLMTTSRLAMQFLLCVIVALCFRTSGDAAQLLTNLSGKTLAVAQGLSVTTTITADFRRYPTGFSVSGLPQGVSADFAPESCYRDCSTRLTINASTSAQPGNYEFIITGKNRSEQATTSVALSITQPASAIVNPPTINPNGGNFANSVTVTLQTATSGASIFYTTNGTTPTQSSSLYTQPLTLSTTTLVKAQAFKTGSTPSTQANAWFTLDASTGALIDLAWADNSDDETGFSIERKTETNGLFAQIATVGADVNSYIDSGLTAGVTYCYRVSAFNAAGASTYTNEACKSATAASPTPTFNYSLTDSGNKSVTRGQTVANSITATLSSGSSQAVSFSTSGLPTGATASYTTSTSCNPSCSRTLNIATSTSTPTGTFTITVTGTGGGVSKTTSFNLTVNAPTPTFDFSLTNGGNKSVIRGQTVTNAITATLSSGSSQALSFSTSGLPTGATASYTTSTSCNPSCSRTLNIATSTSTPTGTFTTTVTGTGGGVSKTTSFNLTVNAPTPTFDFSLTNSGNMSVTRGQSVSNNITATLSSGSAQAVSFSTSGLPTGATASYTTSTSCSPSCSRILNIATSTSSAAGTHTITVTGTGGGVTKTTSFSLTVNASTTGVLDLTWADNSADENGFAIERKTGTNGTFAQISTVAANIRSYADTGLTVGSTYCYRVTAFNSIGASVFSNEGCAAARLP